MAGQRAVPAFCRNRRVCCRARRCRSGRLPDLAAAKVSGKTKGRLKTVFQTAFFHPLQGFRIILAPEHHCVAVAEETVFFCHGVAVNRPDFLNAGKRADQH